MLFVCLSAALLALPTTHVAVDPIAEAPTMFVEANNAFNAGEYAQAATLYQTLVQHGHDSGWLHFDLGNAYLRDHRLGQAIASYRRAQLHLPRAQDVRANLAFARQQAKDAIAPIEVAPIWQTLFFWHYGLSYHELTYITLGINAAFWLCLVAQRWRRDSEAARWLVGLLGISLVLVGASLAYRSVVRVEMLVVAQPEIEVHSGTSRDTVVRFKLHDGAEARFLDGQGGWVRIELSDGKGGWVEAGDVARITLM